MPSSGGEHHSLSIGGSRSARSVTLTLCRRPDRVEERIGHPCPIVELRAERSQLVACGEDDLAVELDRERSIDGQSSGARGQQSPVRLQTVAVGENGLAWF